MAAEDTLRDDSTLTIPEHVLARKAGGESVLLNLANERYYGLPGVGARLWDLVESGTTFGGAVTTLLAEYDVPRERLSADLAGLVAELRENGLVLVDAP